MTFVLHSARVASRCPMSPSEFRGCYTLLLGVGERIRGCSETSWLCRGNNRCRGTGLISFTSADLFLWPLLASASFFLHFISKDLVSFLLQQECYFAFSTERPHSGQGYWGAFVLHFVISPCCEIGQVNKPREKSIYASGLKAGSLRKRKGYKRDAWLKLSTHCSFSFHFPPASSLHSQLSRKSFLRTTLLLL